MKRIMLNRSRQRWIGMVIGMVWSVVFLQAAPDDSLILSFLEFQTATGRRFPEPVNKAYEIKVRYTQVDFRKSCADVYKDGKHIVRLMGCLGYCRVIRDNHGKDWLYFITLVPQKIHPWNYFCLFDLSQIRTNIVNTWKWQDVSGLITGRWKPLPGPLDSSYLCHDALTGPFCSPAVRFIREKDSLFVWTMESRVGSGGFVSLHWARVPVTRKTEALFPVWHNLCLNPNGEVLGVKQNQERYFCETVLSKGYDSTLAYSEHIQRFQSLPHGPQKWAEGVQLALRGGKEAERVLRKAFLLKGVGGYKMVPCKGKRGWYLVGEDGMPVRQNGKIKVFDGHREDPTLAEFSLIGLRQRFRFMLVELLGLTGCEDPQTQQFIRKGLDLENWKNLSYFCNEGEQVKPSQRIQSGIERELAAMACVAAGLSGREDLWQEILERKRWANEELPEALKEAYLYGHAMVIGAFYRWVIQQVGKERFVREIWFQRPTAEWWERWEKTPQGQDWIQWYDKIRRQGPKISQLPD